MDKIISKIVSKIEFNEKEFPSFNDPNYKSYEISIDKFHSFNTIASTKKLIFVDGGALEIIGAPNLSLYFNRIYYTIYQNNFRSQNKLFEFYTIVSTKNVNNEIIYQAEITHKTNQFEFSNLEFNSFDKTIITGCNRIKISKIGEIIRRFAEVKVASLIDANNAVIILDGSLEAKYTYEEIFLNILFNNKNIIGGLAKTCDLLTNNGNSFPALLNRKKQNGVWYYYPACKINNSCKGEIYFVKLHSKSDYVFKLEVRNENDYNINEILSLLMNNSKDPIFLGYPYGLIEADRFSRVSKKEKDSLIMQLKIRIGKKFEKLKPYLNTINAHEILDDIS